MTSQPQPRVFNIPLSDTSAQDGPSSVQIRVQEPRLSAQNLSLTTWTSSLVLARLLHRFQPDLTAADDNASPSPVLELGSGTGLAGLAASIVWQTRVLLTDLPPIVPGLATNIDLNAHLLPASTTQSANQDLPTVSCGVLDWSDPDTLTFTPSKSSLPSPPDQTSKFPTILAADTVYCASHPDLLCATVRHRLARTPTARFILVYPLRVAYLDDIRRTWELLEQGGLRCLEEGKEVVNLDDEDDHARKKDWDDEALCEWSIWGWRD